MANVSKKEMMAIQAGATAIGGIVAETAKICGRLASNGGDLNRSAGMRGGCSVMLPGLLAMASLIGLKDGRLCSSIEAGDSPQDFVNETSVLFTAVLLAKMSGEIVARSNDECLLTVEFGADILSQTLEVVEKILGPADGKIDSTLISTAREAISTGNKALDMLNRLVTAGRSN